MAIIELEINSKLYQIGCDDEDQAKILEYAAVLNKKIEEFKQQDPVFFMGLNDERIFLFQALTLISEIEEQKALSSYAKESTTRIGDSIAKNTEVEQASIFMDDEIPMVKTQEEVLLEKLSPKVEKLKKTIKLLQNIVKV